LDSTRLPRLREELITPEGNCSLLRVGAYASYLVTEPAMEASARAAAIERGISDVDGLSLDELADALATLPGTGSH